MYCVFACVCVCVCVCVGRGDVVVGMEGGWVRGKRRGVIQCRRTQGIRESSHGTMIKLKQEKIKIGWVGVRVRMEEQLVFAYSTFCSGMFV